MDTLTRIERVVVPMDGSSLSEQAIPYAQSIAGACGKITLLKVIAEPEVAYDPLGAGLLTSAEILATAHVQAEKHLKAAVDRWSDPAFGSLVAATRVGDAAEEILAGAHECGADAIVMASKGRGAFARLTLGSVTDRVARASDIPVVVIRPDDALADMSRPLLRRLVVPLDGSDRALSAVPVARSLANQLHASILLVTVADFARKSPPAIAYGAAYSREVYDHYMARLEEDELTALEKVAAELSEAGIPTTCEVQRGAPAEAIVEVTRHGDLVVMTSHGRGGFRRWVIGSVAEKLIRYSPAPVMLVPARRSVIRSAAESDAFPAGVHS